MCRLGSSEGQHIQHESAGGSPPNGGKARGGGRAVDQACCDILTQYMLCIKHAKTADEANLVFVDTMTKAAQQFLKDDPKLEKDADRKERARELAEMLEERRSKTRAG